MNTPDISRAMKRLVGVALASALMAVPCTAVAAEAGVPLDAAHFPDAAFREVIKQYDTDGNGVFSQQELADVTYISEGCYSESDTSCNITAIQIASIQGIEYFTSLRSLSIYGTQLKSVDLSRNTALTSLNLERNQLKSVDLSRNTALEYLDLSGNQLAEVDMSSNTALTSLELSDNQLTTLDTSHNTALTWINALHNQLSTVNISTNTALKHLNFYGNQLESIDLSRNTALTWLDLSCNQLISVDTSANTALTELRLGDNQLASVDVSHNTALTKLDLGGNQLASVDVSHNTALTGLDLANNQLASVDVSHNTALTSLWLSDNKLTSLDVSHNTALKSMEISRNSLLWLDGVPESAQHGIYDDGQWYSTSESALDLTQAAPGIDLSRISIVQGGELQDGILTSDDGFVIYTYCFGDAGESLYVQVQFDIFQNTYTVGFDANGGSGNAVLSVSHGDMIEPPEPPTRDGYIFDGWYTEPDGGDAYDFGEPITADVTLYAHWVAQEIPAITFRDVSAVTPHHEDIQWLADNGISTGWRTADGKYEFRGMSAVLRQDMAAFLRREAKNRGVGDAADWKPTDADWKRFRDVNRGTPHAEDILWLAHAGISTGWKEADGSCTFRGMDTVKRQDMAAFLKRLADKAGKANGVKPKTDFTDVSDRTPHAAEVRWLGGSGISTGYRNADGTWRFEGMTSVYRQDMAAFLHRLDNQLGK